MARILYGVAGEGSGHSSRAKIILEHLLSAGHEVKILSHDKGYENLSRYFPVEKISGLRITYKNSEVKYILTAIEYIKKLPSSTRSLNRALSIIDSFKPDIVITDFEPLTALAANIRLTPLLSIDNQHIMIGTAVETPRGSSREKLIIKNIVRYMVPSADNYFITTFFYPRVISRKTKLFPPLVRDEVLKRTPIAGKHILVYTTAENRELMELLPELRVPCVVYGASKPLTTDPQIVYKPHNPETFIDDLASCRAIIATAGFSLISEALYLHKPYLALPVDKQYEQLLNAYYLKKLDYGDYTTKPTIKQIRHFLHKTEHYTHKLSQFVQNGNELLLNAVDAFIKSHV